MFRVTSGQIFYYEGLLVPRRERSLSPMVESSTYAFASPRWVGALHGILVGCKDQLVEHLDGADFLLCEVYTDVPGWVNASSRVATTWGVIDGALVFSDEEVDASEVGMKIVADWEVIAPMGSTLTEDMAPLHAKIPDAMAEGRFSAEVTSAPPEYLSVVHDAIAGITDNTPPS